MNETHNYIVPFADDNTSVALKKASSAIVKMHSLTEIWPRSRSTWSMRNITLTMSGRSPWKQMRQISAEVESRRDAINSVKWNLVRDQIKIERLRKRLAVENDCIERKLIQVSIAQIEESIPYKLNKVNGAIRDILDLEARYDELIAGFGGDLTLEHVEAAEFEANLSRAILQSIRSVRMIGKIDCGNQEFLEQCGVNPSWMQVWITEYLSNEKSVNEASADNLFNAVNVVTKQLVAYLSEASRNRG